jgi:hypothetical protein
MSRLFVLIKRKGAKRWTGAIPARSKATIAALRKSLIGLKKGFTAKIVNSTQLKRVLLGMRPKRTTKKRVVSRRRRK